MKLRTKRKAPLILDPNVRTFQDVKPMRVLFLDDNEERHREFAPQARGHIVHSVWSAHEAIGALAAAAAMGEPFDLVTLDHDLTMEHQLACMKGLPLPPLGDGTGYDVTRWMQDHPEVRARLVVLHTFNEQGAIRMYSALRRGGFTGGGDREVGRGRVARWMFGTMPYAPILERLAAERVG